MRFRVAVVTGGSKGIGYEICRQLASHGVRVTLTARDERRGMEAVEKLKLHGCSDDDVRFHKLDVANPSSCASLADFIKTRFGRLDILVNNAGVYGLSIDMEILNALSPKEDETADPADVPESHQKSMKQTYEQAEECLKTNFHGTKNVFEALVSLLQLSTSARIVNVTSKLGQLKLIPSDSIKEVLSKVDLTEERLIQMSNRFLKNFKEDRLEIKGWPKYAAAYKVSKALVNAYTRIIAKKYPDMCINCVCPGFTKTELNWNTGVLTTEEGARGPVMLALQPDGDHSAASSIELKYQTSDSLQNFYVKF